MKKPSQLNQPKLSEQDKIRSLYAAKCIELGEAHLQIKAVKTTIETIEDAIFRINKEFEALNGK